MVGDPWPENSQLVELAEAGTQVFMGAETVRQETLNAARKRQIRSRITRHARAIS
jgi:hypothetical protein